MVSAAEQMAANTSWGRFGKATDLRSRILFTLGLLIVYRLGTFIPVPGIDGAALREFMERPGRASAGWSSMFTGGALGRMGIFALGIMPYISASHYCSASDVDGACLEQLKKEGEQGRKKINQYTRFGTVALATLQAYGLARVCLSGDLGSLIRAYGSSGPRADDAVGGTMFLMWLGEQITARGIWQRDFLDYLSSASLLKCLLLWRSSLAKAALARSARRCLMRVILMVLARSMFVVFMERALRKIHIQYPRRQVGMKSV